MTEQPVTEAGFHLLLREYALKVGIPDYTAEVEAALLDDLNTPLAIRTIDKIASHITKEASDENSHDKIFGLQMQLRLAMSWVGLLKGRETKND